MLKFLFLGSLFLLQGCAGAILGGTLFGAYFVGSFSGISETKTEYELQKRIEKELSAIKKLKENLNFEIEPIVLGNKIYLVGVASSMPSKAYPMDFISGKYKNYKIIDEVRMAKRGFGSAILDSFIKQKIKLKFVLTNGIRYGNYYIASHNGELVIIGAAEDKYESAKVLELISSTRGIKKVINYVEVRNIDD